MKEFQYIIRIVIKFLIAVIILLLLSYPFYIKSIYRVEYEFNTNLPSSTEVLSIGDGWSWLPFPRESMIERTLSYKLKMQKEQFSEYVSHITYCRNCDSLLITKESGAMYPIEYGDYQYIKILKITDIEVFFTFNLNYN